MTKNTTASGAADTIFQAMADRAYCNYIEQLRRDECLGWEHKVKTGKFGEVELKAHKKAAEYLGAHRAFSDAAKLIAASAPVAPTMVDMVPPATSRDRWMYEQGRLAERDPRTSKAAPAPEPAPMPYPTDAQIDAVYEQTMGQHLRSQDAPAVRRFGRAMFLCAWNAAAPKAAPAINKVSDIIDAYGMTPGQPERVADIPGLAEALEAAFADGSAQVTGALQQGEYLPLPDADTHCYDEDTGKDVWSYSADLVRKVIDADRAMRAAQTPAGSAHRHGAALPEVRPTTHR